MQITATHHASTASLTSKVRRDLNGIVGTWNRDYGVLLLLLIILLNILSCVCLILNLILLLLLSRRRLLTALLLSDILLLTLIVRLRRLLLRGLRWSERNLNVRSGNRERRLTTTNCLCAPMNDFFM